MELKPAYVTGAYSKQNQGR